MAFPSQLLPALLEPFHRCCLLALAPPGAASQQCPGLSSSGAQGHHHPPALSWLCTAPLDCWVPLLLTTAWCWARNLVLSSTQFFKTIICLRTIQQEICKVNSMLSLICSLFSQVPAVAAPYLSCLLLCPAAGSISCWGIVPADSLLIVEQCSLRALLAHGTARCVLSLTVVSLQGLGVTIQPRVLYSFISKPRSGAAWLKHCMANVLQRGFEGALQVWCVDLKSKSTFLERKVRSDFLEFRQSGIVVDVQFFRCPVMRVWTSPNIPLIQIKYIPNLCLSSGIYSKITSLINTPLFSF